MPLHGSSSRWRLLLAVTLVAAALLVLQSTAAADPTLSHPLSQSPETRNSVYLPVLLKAFVRSPIAPTPTPAVPNLILHNGSLLTMEGTNWEAQALAVTNQTILAVGSNAEILALRGPRTQVIDLQGAALLPGFVDAHTHILNDAGRMGLTLQQALQLALQNGITTLANMYTDQAFLIELQRLRDQGDLRVRTSAYLVYANNCGQVVGDWYKAYPPTREPGEMLRIGGVKLFADGGSCGCPAFSYNDRRCGYGDLWFTQDRLNAMVADIQASGYQVAIHALGDRAVEEALNAIQFALAGSLNTPRHRIEHNATIRDELLPRYSQIGPVALIFGAYPCAFRSAPPAEYGRWEWRWRDLLDANPGLHVAWHSDTPYVGPLSPLLNLYSMVTPHDVAADGTTVCDDPAWMTGRALTVRQALPMMNIEGAYALFREEEVGSLKPGKFADLIVLSASPLAVQPEAIKDIQVWATWVNGRVEYCAPGHEGLCPIN